MKAMNRVAGARARAGVVSATIVEVFRSVASKSALLTTSCGAVLVTALLLAPLAAQAQQQQQSQQKAQKTLEEITVTGTRIVTRDNVANSPIVTINATQFQQQNGLNFESYLNKLPEYNPAASPTTTQGDVQITPVNSVGVATISLRGFGPNRSLVLVDGKRTVPINALMETDINSIPSALIQRVETITGGASAVYGADAVSGVTNFILKDNFEGLQVDAQDGISATGDGAERRISAVFGTNSANGKGNIAIGVEHYKRNAASQRNNPFYKDGYNNPNAPGFFFFLQGAPTYDCQFNCPGQGAVQGAFGSSAANPVFNWFLPNITYFRPYSFNADGTLFNSNSPAGVANYTSGSHYNFYPQNQLNSAVFDSSAQQFSGLKYENPDAYTSAPQERYSLFATGHYDFGDRLSMYSRAMWAQSKTKTLLFGTDAISGWETQVPYDPATDSPLSTDPNVINYADANSVHTAITSYMANGASSPYANPGYIPTGAAGAGHPVPVQLAALLNSRGATNYCLAGATGCPGVAVPGVGSPTTNTALVGTFAGFLGAASPWLPGWEPDTSLPPRSTVNTNTTWQIQSGVNFKMFKDWTGEAYVSHGESYTYNNANGNLSLERFRALVNQPDWGRGATLTGNTVSDGASTPTRPGFGAATVHCTSGFYNTFFAGDAPLSQDCFNAINATLQTRAGNTQSIVELNFQGPLANIKPGQIRGAFGYQHRENGATFVPDILQSTYSFLDQVVGVYPTGTMDAHSRADDVYLEARIPLISNKKGAQSFSLDLGARRSRYEWTKDTNTWKSLISWQINDWFRIRGGFNRAVRSPNLGELFLARQEIFTGGSAYGDPCSVQSTAPFGAGGAAEDPGYVNGNVATAAQGHYAAGQTAAGAKSAALICAALMGGLNGMSPGATLSVNADGTLNVAAGSGAYEYYDQNSAPSPGASPFAWVDQVGNPNLQPETADTWTWGFVMNPPFKKPLLSNITLSLDTYRINLNQAIMLSSLDVVSYDCFGAVNVTTVGEARAQAASPACQLTPRDPRTGGALSTTVSYNNQATIKTQGADFALNWRMNFADMGSKIKGGLGFNLHATYLDYYKTKRSPATFDVWTDWKGSLGPNLTGTNGGAYDYRLFSTLTYFRSAWSVNLRWRGLPGVYTANYATQQAIKAHDASVAAGGPGIMLSYVPSTEIQTDSYRVFDLSFNYTIRKISIRGGVTNILNTSPPYVGPTMGYAPGTDLTAVCGSAPGCTNPTSHSLPSASASGAFFNGGYYDTLGRQYFVGVDMTF